MATDFANISDKKGTFEIGLKLLKIRGSSVGFFRSGRTKTLTLKLDGTEAVDNRVNPWGNSLLYLF